MDKGRIYEETIKALREQIETHQCPTVGRSSITAFCEEYAINKANLVTILGGHKDISVGLFYRIAAALGEVSTSEQSKRKPALDHVSLKAYLEIEYTAVMELLVAVQMNR